MSSLMFWHYCPWWLVDVFSIGGGEKRGVLVIDLLLGRDTIMGLVPEVFHRDLWPGLVRGFWQREVGAGKQSLCHAFQVTW